MTTRRGGGKESVAFISLSFTDDSNSIRIGKLGPLGETLETAATEYKMKWDRAKHWKNELHVGVNLNGRKPCRFRTGRAMAAFNVIRRLTRPPSEVNRKVVIGQLIPILTYGSETPLEESSRLAVRMARWVAMGYQGSSRTKIEDITGTSQLGVLMYGKRVRWAVSAYWRDELELRSRAERILREELGGEEDVALI